MASKSSICFQIPGSVGSPITGAFEPELVFIDDDPDTDVAVQGAIPEADSARDREPSAADEAGEDGVPGAAVSDGINKYGYMPCYRSFRDLWFWKEKPWDQAHLFLDLLLDANRVARRCLCGGWLMTIERGQLWTSFLSLADKAGRNRKTVTRWLGLLESDGELKVEKIGQQGVIVTLCKYDLYALDGKKSGQR